MKYLLLITCIMLPNLSDAQKIDIAQKEKRMDIIYVCHYQAANRYREYKIDLKNKIFWKYNMAAHNLKQRNETAKNEGYDFVENLTAEKTSAFLLEANKNMFDSWKKIHPSRCRRRTLVEDCYYF